jgi:hypothetical protein
VVPLIEAGDLNDRSPMLRLARMRMRLVLMAIWQAKMESARYDIGNVASDIERMKVQLTLPTDQRARPCCRRWFR